MTALPLDLAALPRDVARVTRLDLERASDLLELLVLEIERSGPGPDRRQGDELRVADARPAQELRGRGVAREDADRARFRNVGWRDAGSGEALALARDGVLLALEDAPARVIDDPEAAAD